MAAQRLISKIIRETVRPIRQLFNLPRTLSCLYKDIRAYLAFPNAYIAYRGKFNSFKEAMDCAPKDKKAFYIEALNPNMDSFLEQVKTQKVGNTEYPIFFWLNEIAKTCKGKSAPFKVLDFGGGDGGHYFSFVNTARILNPHNSLIDNLQWQVAELPQKVEFGNKIVHTLGVKNLHFTTTNLAKANEHNVLLASGVFMYIENILDLFKAYCVNNGGGRAHYSS